MAINTHRAQRRTTNYLGPRKTTDEHVAPGTYSNTHNEPFKLPTERAVPFNSMQEKVLCQNLNTSSYTPGPGAYTGQQASAEEANGLGPTSLKSKVARLGPTAPGSSVYTTSTIEKNPGPGSYIMKSNWEHEPQKDLRPAANPFREALDKTVPSIPLQKLAPDQQQDHQASDIPTTAMRHTGDRGDTVGPGEYDPRGEQITHRSQPQVTFRGQVMKDRSLWEPSAKIDSKQPAKENPGPGTYEPARGMSDPSAADPDSENIATTFQFTSKTMMPHQRKEADERVVPGPGQYDMVGEIERSATTTRARAQVQGDRSRFGSSGQRIGWSRPVDHPYVDPYHIHNVPGPGHYPTNGGVFPPAGKDKEKEAEKALPTNRKKKFYGVHHPMIVMALQETQGPLEAFGSTDDRACNKIVPQSTPAPGAYNRDEARGNSMASDLREKAKVGRKGVFGTMADRFFGSPMAGKEGVHDIGMDDAAEVLKGGANAEPRAVFQSQSPRFHNAPGQRETLATKVGQHDTPAPGAYIVEKEPNYRSPFRHPRVEHLSFGACTNRFHNGRDIFVGHQSPLTNPGPGDYNNLLLDECINGSAALKEKRKLAQPVGATTEAVGPGSYGSIDTHMLKKTFNVSTQAPTAGSQTPRTRRKGRPRAEQAMQGEM